MPDVFVSYAHKDRERIRPIVDILKETGWSLWWDRGIEPGMKWLAPLEKALMETRAVMVIWTKSSCNSDWVHKEAKIGIEKGAYVPVIIDEDAIPADFSEYQATDLSKWRGQERITEINTLLTRLASIVPPSRIDTVRPGYDPQFLGAEFNITLPGVPGSAVVLRYNHFTVVMNPARRLAHYSIYNVDGKDFVPVKRERKMDDWAPDPLLPDSLQMELSLLRHSDYDRGHLMSRSIVSWGEERSAFISAGQAFFWSNIAPQHKKLNRMWWLKLERWEKNTAKKFERITGLSGPVFSDDDEPFRGELELEDGLVAYDTFHIPRAYWKVVFFKKDKKMYYDAYFMDQYDMNERKVPGGFALTDYRCRLKQLEEVSGLRFGDICHEANQMN